MFAPTRHTTSAWSGLAITVPLLVVTWASHSSAPFGAQSVLLQMSNIAATLLSLVLLVSWFPLNSARLAPDSPFDEYGTISWHDEKARLDNFAIQLQHWEKLIGYILVVEAVDGCPGEAQARAVRAKRYLVEYRGVANNRLIWKVACCSKELNTTLLRVPPEYPYSLYGYGATISGKAGPLNKSCKLKLVRIRKSIG